MVGMICKMGRVRFDYTGLEFVSEKYGEYFVVSCNTSKKVKICFKRTGFEYETTIQQVKAKCVKDPTQHLDLVFGNGIFDLYRRVRECKTKEEKLWRDMISRCHSVKKLIKQPSYATCYVSEEFKIYSKFADWCNKQVGFGNDGWQLDKDILSDGECVYSSDTCCFIPAELNSAFSSFKLWKDGKIKHTIFNGKFVVRVIENGVKRHLGSHETLEQANFIYGKHKRESLKKLAERWEGVIDDRVFKRLMLLSEEI